jgi:hypothetical protein
LYENYNQLLGQDNISKFHIYLRPRILIFLDFHIVKELPRMIIIFLWGLKKFYRSLWWVNKALEPFPANLSKIRRFVRERIKPGAWFSGGNWWQLFPHPSSLSE